MSETIEQAAAAPRKREAPRTKAAILEAAKVAVSSCGYGDCGVRDVAARAGVNAALVVRYFGSKEGLFEAALREALNPEVLLLAGRAGFGAHVAAHLANTSPVNAAAMMILALGDKDVGAVAARLLEEITQSALSEFLGPPEAETRAAQITILCTGFVLYRRLLPITPLAAGHEAGTVDWLAAALQEIVDR